MLELPSEPSAQDGQTLTLELRKHDLIDLWERGIINNATYVGLILRMVGVERPISIEQFIHDWRGTVDADTGKCKKLTVKQLKVAIATLEEKEEFQEASSEIVLL